MNLPGLGSLPMPLKVVGAALGGASLLGMAFLAFRGNKTALFIIAAGVVIIVLMLLLYKLVLGWMKKRKASPLTQGLTGNAAAAPQGISEPARRARLDDLRRNFEQGVDKFRAAGKNLYSVPWYMVVGEPGSGKTEAIRHCNVGFPPGLQDQLQGAGGTLNMNWWFTNQAIILDTAGRLMFEEVAPGTTNEWGEFLKLLKNNRPNCPINGMLLVIPVDTLIKDSADNIEKKATKIAQQFDQIQRTLGVRFPVFVIITKCDLLNGFREFFDDLNDPMLQHQIMGWSNPSSLDERFDPATVINHMETVKARLTERRMHLLLDPVNTEDPQGRRVDQVDALYALPDSITKIGPRLRRYLEMIFVAGEWSPKPLFLRGIYFTSSMTEGSALDAELAEVLGVPVDSLPEGRVWRRDRAYFLRDLFIEKVFREKGLVTRATNADKQQRSRRAVVLTVGFLAVLAVGILTWFGSRTLDKSIGVQRDFWVAAADNKPEFMEIVDPKNDAYNTVEVPIGKQKSSVAGFFGDNLKLAQEEIQIPVIFKPMTFLGGDVNGERHKAYRELFQATVLRPLYDATRQKLLSPPWTQTSTDALAQLMKLEYAKATQQIPAGDHPNVELDPMFQLVLSAKDYDAYSKETKPLQKPADWVYSADAGGAAAWPPAALQPGTTQSIEVVTKGLTAAMTYLNAQKGTDSSSLKAIFVLRTVLGEFSAAENKLLFVDDQKTLSATQPIDTRERYIARFGKEWTDTLQRLRGMRPTIATAWEAVSKGKPDATLQAIYSQEIQRVTAETRSSLEKLLRYTAEAPQKDVTGDPSWKFIISARTQLLQAQKDLETWAAGTDAQKMEAEMKRLDADYLSLIKAEDGSMKPRFEVESYLYTLTDTNLVRYDKPPALPAGPLSGAIDAADKDFNTVRASIDKVKPANEEDRVAKVANYALFAMSTSTRAKKSMYSIATLDPLARLNAAEAWQGYIKANPGSLKELVHEPIPLVKFPDGQEKSFDPRFSPDGVGTVIDNLKQMAALAADPTKVLDAQALAADAESRRKSLDVYMTTYLQYWRKQTMDDAVAFSAKDWPAFSGELANQRERNINGGLKDYAERVANALQRVGDQAGASEVRLAYGVIDKPNILKECADVLDHWKNLGEKASLARREILLMTPNDFMDKFVTLTLKNSEGLISRWWQGLAVEGVKVLANDSQKDIQGGLLALANFERFPLAKPGDPKKDLTQADIILARAALENIRGAAATLNAAAGTTRTIAQGGLTRDRDIDSYLERLRGTDLLKEKQAYFDQISNFLGALPAGEQPMSVSLSVNKDPVKISDISRLFVSMAVNQGGKLLTDFSLQSPRAEQCDVQYAGGDVTLQFRDTPNAPIKLTETIPGPWVPFRLIATAKSTLRESPTKWHVEYTILDANKTPHSLWLILEFKGQAQVPELKDWPIPPGGGRPPG